ncbi:MAG: ECF transporter S component [Eubacterium sp.]|nr:ECF transporter S component [Eubacterium sp.]MDE6766729.1 ECF transporter S component [Eubacterium sp.]
MKNIDKMSAVKKSIITAVCIALCVVLPQAFHAIPNAGSIYCPMHIPVLLCGLACGWQYGLFCGLAGPLLSSLFTGMPPTPMLPPMMLECAVYGLAAGIVIKFIFTKNTYADLYISLVSAMLAGRIIAGIAKALIFARGEITIAAWATSYFATSLPGIIIQLTLIPTIVFALMKANLIPKRYLNDAN